MSQDNARLANKSFGQILSDGFNLYFQNFVKIIIPFAIFYILGILVQALVLTELTWQLATSRGAAVYLRFLNDPNYIPEGSEFNDLMDYYVLNLLLGSLQNLIGALFTIISMCLVSTFLYKKYKGLETDFEEDMKGSFNSNIIYPILLLGILVPILPIINILIIGFFIFLVFTYNMEKYPNSVSDAKKISKGAFLKILGTFIISALISSLISLLSEFIISIAWNVTDAEYVSWYAPSTRNYLMIFLYFLVYNIVDILIAPLFICLLTPLFASQEARYELGPQMSYQARSPNLNYPQQAPVYRPYQPSQPQPSDQALPQSSREIEQKGMFCPYCGEKITTPKKFCPNCGESLQFE